MTREDSNRDPAHAPGRPIVVTEALTKRYGALAALSDCDIRVDEGDVFGLLGPNGAGKTTLLRLLLGFLKPSSGQATVMGHDCYRDAVQVHRQVAYLPGEPRLFRRMRGREVIDFFARIRPGVCRKRGDELVERLALDPTRRVSQMSTGMKQKLALVVTFMARAPLTILDEPTANLDPDVRKTVAQMVRENQVEGRTLVFSSHVLPEVEQLCNRVVILRKGRIAVEQAMSDLRKCHRVFSPRRAGSLDVPDRFRGRVRIASSNPLEMYLDGDLADWFDWLASLHLCEVTIEPLGLQAVYDRIHAQDPPPSDVPALAAGDRA